MEISEVEVILKTWSKIESPPKPSKNAEIIIFTEIALKGILDITETPFVSSIIPVNKPSANEVGSSKVLSIGEMIIDKMSKTLVLLRIDKITLNSITKPPIMTIVVIELIMLFWRIVPKLLKEGAILVFEAIVLFKLRFLDFLLNFQNLKIIPTVKQDKRWVINKIRPIVVFPKREIPNSTYNK